MDDSPKERCFGFRPATVADEPAIRALVARIYADYGDTLDVEREDPHLASPCAHFRGGGGELWVADAAGTIAGCGGVVIHGESAHIKAVYVAPEFRRRGIARTLTSLALDHARAAGCPRIGLWSDTRFVEAHRLYESLGFQRVGKRGVAITNTFSEWRYELP